VTDRQVGDGDAGVGEAELGILDQVADDRGQVAHWHRIDVPSHGLRRSWAADAVSSPIAPTTAVEGAMDTVAPPSMR
jgi:hypothetical protein